MNRIVNILISHGWKMHIRNTWSITFARGYYRVVVYHDGTCSTYLSALSY